MPRTVVAMPAPAHPHAPRSRLDQAPDAYRIALEVADQLDGRGLDLWAAGVRSCLDATGSTARQQHLAAELIRLSQMRAVRQEGLILPIREALARLEAGLGDLDVPSQPLYTAARDLADHLEIGGGRRWLGRLRAVLADPERTATARLERVVTVLQRMRDEAGTAASGGTTLPEGTATRAESVLARIPRHHDVEQIARYLAFALHPPQPSRRLVPGDVP